MKDVTITLKDESITGHAVHSVAEALTKQGLQVSSVQPYGVITGSAADNVVDILKQNQGLNVNDRPYRYQIAPPDSDIQ